MEPSIYIISGISGSGKSTISDLLIERHPKLSRAITATSRTPRPGELFGYHYFFVDRERFEWLKETDQLLEYTAPFTGHLYGTLRYAVDQILKQGGAVLFVVDIHGVESITKHFPNARTVFLQAPSEDEQRIRLERRGTVGDELTARIKLARDEHQKAGQLGIKVVVNDVLEEALAQVESIFFK